MGHVEGVYCILKRWVKDKKQHGAGKAVDSITFW
jgi:hypothetical protein